MRGTNSENFGCTGEKGPAFEDTKNWCLGWVMEGSENCTKKPEYEYETPEESETEGISASPKTYGGGGGLAGGAWSWSPPSEGNGGLGGAIGSENIQ